MIKKYALYLLRWQLSTPILAFVLIAFTSLGPLWATILANLIGGLIFFWFDRWLFSRYKLNGEWWEVDYDRACHDCGKDVKVSYRLIKANKYDKTEDSNPEFRCRKCSKLKYHQTQNQKSMT